MGSLTSERIDSTNTTISLVQPLHSVQNTFCFLTDKAFCSCLWAFFLFFINSTFNLGPGVIACTKCVIFIYLFFRLFQASEGKREAPQKSKKLHLLCRLQEQNRLRPFWWYLRDRGIEWTLGGRLGMALRPRVWDIEGLSRTKNSLWIPSLRKARSPLRGGVGRLADKIVSP